MAELGTQFIPTSQVWDIAQLKDMDVTSPEFKELMIRLYQNLNLMAMAVNDKPTGYRSQDPYVTGKYYPPNANLSSSSDTTPTYRQGQAIHLDFGALPNTASKTVAHNITVNEAFTLVRIVGAATDPVAFKGVAIPNQDIKVEIDATNVTITTAADYSAYTVCSLEIEYLMS